MLRVRSALRGGQEAREIGAGTFACRRCGARLHRSDSGSLESILALATAALVLLMVANRFPVLGLDVNGQRIDTSVIGAVREAVEAQMQPVAVLVR